MFIEAWKKTLAVKPYAAVEAAVLSGTTVLWYALPDFVRSRALRTLVKTSSLAGVATFIARNTQVDLMREGSWEDFAARYGIDQASVEYGESTGETGGEVDATDSVEAVADVTATVEATDERAANESGEDKYGDGCCGQTKEMSGCGGNCGCGSGGCGTGATTEISLDPAEFMELVKSNPLKAAPIIGATLAVVGGSIAVAVLGEKFLFARGERRRAMGIRAAHTRQALALAALTGIASFGAAVAEAHTYVVFPEDDFVETSEEEIVEA